MTLQPVSSVVATFPQFELSNQSAEFAAFFEKMKGLVTTLAEQNHQMKLAQIALESQIEEVNVLAAARTKCLQGRVADLDASLQSVPAYCVKEEQKGYKDCEEIREVQKAVVTAMELACKAKAEAAEQRLRTQYTLELPDKIKKAKEEAKKSTENACNEKFKLEEGALDLRQKKQIRKLIDSTRARLDIAYCTITNRLIPEMTTYVNSYRGCSNMPIALSAAEAAYRGTLGLVSYCSYPEYFRIVGFDMRITYP